MSILYQTGLPNCPLRLVLPSLQGSISSFKEPEFPNCQSKCATTYIENSDPARSYKVSAVKNSYAWHREDRLTKPVPFSLRLIEHTPLLSQTHSSAPHNSDSTVLFESWPIVIIKYQQNSRTNSYQGKAAKPRLTSTFLDV